MATGARRIAAFGIDWCLIVVWGGLLFAAFSLWPGIALPRPSGPWSGQLLGLLSMTLPVIAYFTLAESSRWRASLGKRVLGLGVESESGGRLSFARALTRNLIKFAPWEFGHLLAQQAVFSAERGMPAWTILPGAIAFIGPVVWLVELFRTGRTPYDRSSASIVRARKA